jgi:hypothetical protein
VIAFLLRAGGALTRPTIHSSYRHTRGFIAVVPRNNVAILIIHAQLWHWFVAFFSSVRVVAVHVALRFTCRSFNLGLYFLLALLFTLMPSKASGLSTFQDINVIARPLPSQRRKMSQTQHTELVIPAAKHPVLGSSLYIWKKSTPDELLTCMWCRSGGQLAMLTVSDDIGTIRKPLIKLLHLHTMSAEMSDARNLGPMWQYLCMSITSILPLNHSWNQYIARCAPIEVADYVV